MIPEESVDSANEMDAWIITIIKKQKLIVIKVIKLPNNRIASRFLNNIYEVIKIWLSRGVGFVARGRIWSENSSCVYVYVPGPREVLPHNFLSILKRIITLERVEQVKL